MPEQAAYDVKEYELTLEILGEYSDTMTYAHDAEDGAVETQMESSGEEINQTQSQLGSNRASQVKQPAQPTQTARPPRSPMTDIASPLPARS